MSVVYVSLSMLGVAAMALMLSTFTDSPLGAALGALAVPDRLDAAADPGRGRGARSPTCRPATGCRSSTSSETRSCGATSCAASLLQGVYVVVFLGAAWANFTTKDITS